jgi:hypothetical protein
LETVILQFTATISYIVRNGSQDDALLAIGIWHDFLSEDEILQQLYTPKKEFIEGLQLNRFQNSKEVLEFIRVLELKYGYASSERIMPFSLPLKGFGDSSRSTKIS